jgi:hypothetical protein
LFLLRAAIPATPKIGLIILLRNTCKAIARNQKLAIVAKS